MNEWNETDHQRVLQQVCSLQKPEIIRRKNDGGDHDRRSTSSEANAQPVDHKTVHSVLPHVMDKFVDWIEHVGVEIKDRLDPTLKGQNKDSHVNIASARPLAPAKYLSIKLSHAEINAPCFPQPLIA